MSSSSSANNSQPPRDETVDDENNNNNNSTKREGFGFENQQQGDPGSSSSSSRRVVSSGLPSPYTQPPTTATSRSYTVRDLDRAASPQQSLHPDTQSSSSSSASSCRNNQPKTFPYSFPYPAPPTSSTSTSSSGRTSQHYSTPQTHQPSTHQPITQNPTSPEVTYSMRGSVAPYPYPQHQQGGFARSGSRDEPMTYRSGGWYGGGEFNQSASMDSGSTSASGSGSGYGSGRARTTNSHPRSPYPGHHDPRPRSLTSQPPSLPPISALDIGQANMYPSTTPYPYYFAQGGGGGGGGGGGQASPPLPPPHPGRYHPYSGSTPPHPSLPLPVGNFKSGSLPDIRMGSAGFSGMGMGMGGGMGMGMGMGMGPSTGYGGYGGSYGSSRTSPLTLSPPKMGPRRLSDVGYDDGRGDPMRNRRYQKKTPPNGCHVCSSLNTPEWRRGPSGLRTLCNACGLTAKKFKDRHPPPKTIDEVYAQLIEIGQARVRNNRYVLGDANKARAAESWTPPSMRSQDQSEPPASPSSDSRPPSAPIPIQGGGPSHTAISEAEVAMSLAALRGGLTRPRNERTVSGNRSQGSGGYAGDDGDVRSFGSASESMSPTTSQSPIEPYESPTILDANLLLEMSGSPGVPMATPLPRHVTSVDSIHPPRSDLDPDSSMAESIRPRSATDPPASQDLMLSSHVPPLSSSSNPMSISAITNRAA